MMHGWWKSDPVIVATKPANADGKPAAELVEPRAGAEESARQRDMRRTLRQLRMFQALAHARRAQPPRATYALQRTLLAARGRIVKYPRWEPDALL